MDQRFDAREFLARINNGSMDGYLIEEIQKLTRDELNELAHLMAEQIASKRP